MRSNFSNLPQNIIHTVYSFLDVTSLLRMREVCIKLCRHVSPFAYSQPAKIRQFKIYPITSAANRNERIGDLYRAEFEMVAQRGYALFKFCVNKTRCRLKYPDYTENLPKCSVLVGISSHKIIKVNLAHNEMRSLFENLKPLSERAVFDSVHVTYTEELLTLCQRFLDGKLVRVLDIKPFNQDVITHLNQYLDIFYEWRPEVVYIRDLSLTKDSIELLLKTAEICEFILFDMRTSASNVDKVPISIVQTVLSRKCRCLRLINSPNCNVYTPDEVEKLVQYFHHSGRNVSFFANIGADVAEIHIGEYDVKIPRAGRIIIKHRAN